jgi:hypothetical protein
MRAGGWVGGGGGGEENQIETVDWGPVGWGQRRKREVTSWFGGGRRPSVTECVVVVFVVVSA